MLCYKQQKGLERLFLCRREVTVGTKTQGISHQQGQTAETVSDDFPHSCADTSSFLSDSKKYCYFGCKPIL